MLESFLDNLREDGKIRVLSSQNSHEITAINMAPIVTRDSKVGVLLQDRSSGKSFMIEINKPEEISNFITQLQQALNVASGVHEKLHTLMKERSDART